MPDDFQNEFSDDYTPAEPSASAMFLEMMRQQAAQRERASAEHAPQSPLPPAERAPRAPHSAVAAPVEVSAPPEPPAPTPTAEADAPQQRIRAERARRRQKRRRQRALGAVGGAFHTVYLTAITAIVAATIFTWWTRPEFLSAGVRNDLSMALATATSQGLLLQPTPLPVTPNWLRRIGIVSGHRGPENDPGAVCPDGLTEASINFNVAQLVVRNLQARGYTVDLLDEFDPRLNQYEAELLVSIHANTCQDFGEVVTGYLISTADARSGSGNDQLLVECVASHYQQASQLERRYGLTRDMTDYHIFREISILTPAAILELGFMLHDRAVLTENPELLARGITDGILCYLEPGDLNILATLQAPTPNPILPTQAPTLTPEPSAP